MPTVSVHGNSPNTGPGMLTAKEACNDLNQLHPTWKLTYVWTKDNTQYTSTIATRDALWNAVSGEFPQYLVN